MGKLAPVEGTNDCTARPRASERARVGSLRLLRFADV